MRRADRNIPALSEIESIIKESDVCRIAISNDNIPYIVTMNFGYKGGPSPCFYFHCAAEGRKLDMIKKNNFVCFEMDTDHTLSTGIKGCDWGMKFRSVVGYGRIRIVDDKNEKIAGLGYIMKQYGGSDKSVFDEKIVDCTMVLRLEISEITGKKKQN